MTMRTRTPAVGSIKGLLVLYGVMLGLWASTGVCAAKSDLDHISAVDKTSQTVTISGNSKVVAQTYKITDTTQITINNQPAKFQAIKAGMTVQQSEIGLPGTLGKLVLTTTGKVRTKSK